MPTPLTRMHEDGTVYQQRDGIFKVDTFVRYGYQKLMHRACWESRIETPVDQLGHPYMQIYAGLWGLTS